MEKNIEGYQKGIKRASAVLAIIFGMLCLLAPFTKSFHLLGYGVFWLLGSFWYYITAILIAVLLTYKIIFLKKPDFLNWKVKTGWGLMFIAIRILAAHIAFKGQETLNYEMYQSCFNEVATTGELFGESKALSGIFGYYGSAVFNLGGASSFYPLILILIISSLVICCWDLEVKAYKNISNRIAINKSKKAELKNLEESEPILSEHKIEEIEDQAEFEAVLDNDPFFSGISYDYDEDDESTTIEELSFAPALDESILDETKQSRMDKYKDVDSVEEQIIADDNDEDILNESVEQVNEENDEESDIERSVFNPFDYFGEKNPEEVFNDISLGDSPIHKQPISLDEPLMSDDDFSTADSVDIYEDIEDSVEIANLDGDIDINTLDDDETPYKTFLSNAINDESVLEELNLEEEMDDEDDDEEEIHTIEDEFLPDFGGKTLSTTESAQSIEEHNNFINGLDSDYENKQVINNVLTSADEEVVQSNNEVVHENIYQKPTYQNHDNEVPASPKVEPMKKMTPEEKLGLRPAKERLPYNIEYDPLLKEYPNEQLKVQEQAKDAEIKKVRIQELFDEFNSGAYVDGYTIGPSVTRFHVKTKPGVSMTSVNKYTKDISVKLMGIATRYEEIVKGLDASGLEIGNSVSSMVGFKETLSNLPKVDEKHKLYIPFGKTISGEYACGDLSKFPHMLISGSSGSGKSVYMQSILLTLIIRNSPEDLKLMIIDPKRVEFSFYAGLPHLLCPIITDAIEAKTGLEKLVNEMERRYSIIEHARVRSVQDFNRRYCKKHNVEPLPYIVCVIDEYGDLVHECKDVAEPVLRIAAKARAAGIHLIITTQRPDASIINGTIKANLSTKVALRVASSVDSQVILGQGGAEDLAGNGDMLIACKELANKGFTRAQGCFVDDDEIENIIEECSKNREPEYYPEFLDLQPAPSEPEAPKLSKEEVRAQQDDEVFEYIKEWTMNRRYISISKIQDNFEMGYPRASKMFSRLQEEGIIEEPSPDRMQSSKGTRVIYHAKGWVG